MLDKCKATKRELPKTIRVRADALLRTCINENRYLFREVSKNHFLIHLEKLGEIIGLGDGGRMSEGRLFNGLIIKRLMKFVFSGRMEGGAGWRRYVQRLPKRPT